MRPTTISPVLRICDRRLELATQHQVHRVALVSLPKEHAPGGNTCVPISAVSAASEPASRTPSVALSSATTSAPPRCSSEAAIDTGLTWRGTPVPAFSRLGGLRGRRWITARHDGALPRPVSGVRRNAKKSAHIRPGPALRHGSSSGRSRGPWAPGGVRSQKPWRFASSTTLAVPIACQGPIERIEHPSARQWMRREGQVREETDFTGALRILYRHWGRHAVVLPSCRTTRKRLAARSARDRPPTRVARP